MVPAPVVGEHPVGFKHVAMLAAVGHLAAFEQQVEVGAHGLDPGFQALEFLWHIVGDDIGDDDSGLVEYGAAERDAVIERNADDL